MSIIINIKQLYTMNKYILFALTLILFSACNNGRKTPDVSDIKTNIKIIRFDKELFQLKENPDFNTFKKQYHEFLNLYSNKVISLGNPDDSNYMTYLNKFLFDSIINEVATKVEQKYPNLSQQEEELNSAFRYIKYYFPNKTIPNIYAQISGFNQTVVVADNIIGISLDKYLGADCKFYVYLNTPKYMRKNREAKYIAQDIVMAYALTEFPFQPKTENLVSNMIYKGKIHYLMQLMMPEKSEAEIMKYTQEQQEWCEENESQMWGFIIEKKHLFTSHYRTIVKYVNDGPFTPGMPKDAPAKTGVWLGLQIVKSYMNQHKEITLQQLMQINDYGKILRESGYQP